MVLNVNDSDGMTSAPIGRIFWSSYDPRRGSRRSKISRNSGSISRTMDSGGRSRLNAQQGDRRTACHCLTLTSPAIPVIEQVLPGTRQVADLSVLAVSRACNGRSGQSPQNDRQARLHSSRPFFLLFLVVLFRRSRKFVFVLENFSVVNVARVFRGEVDADVGKPATEELKQLVDIVPLQSSSMELTSRQQVFAFQLALDARCPLRERHRRFLSERLVVTVLDSLARSVRYLADGSRPR